MYSGTKEQLQIDGMRYFCDKARLILGEIDLNRPPNEVAVLPRRKCESLGYSGGLRLKPIGNPKVTFLEVAAA
jgi:hypothetical protein